MQHLVPSGPFLQYLGADAQQAWWASVLVVLPPARETPALMTAAPVLTLYAASGTDTGVC